MRSLADRSASAREATERVSTSAFAVLLVANWMRSLISAMVAVSSSAALATICTFAVASLTAVAPLDSMERVEAVAFAIPLTCWRMSTNDDLICSSADLTFTSKSFAERTRSVTTFQVRTQWL